MSIIGPEETSQEESKKGLKNIQFNMKKKEKKIPVGGNIVIDLIPQSFKDIAETRKAKKQWIYIVSVTVLVAILASGLSFGFKMQSQSALDTETKTQEKLELQISQYAEVNQALDSQKESVKLLNQAAGAEIDWTKLIGNIEDALPSGTSISSLSVNTGGTDKDELSSAITMDLVSDSTLGYSDTLKAVEGVSGVQSVEIGGLSRSGENSYDYKMSFTYDTSILTEKYKMGE